jgi:hypothetical protein
LKYLSNNGIADNEVGATICQNSFGKGEMWFCEIEMIGSKKNG